MKYDWLIVDGNNLIHSAPDRRFGDRQGSFESARWNLARQMDRLSSLLAERISIVYDGRVGGRDDALQSTTVEVLFSASEGSADGVIERMVCERRQGVRVLVVTSDRMERDTVEAAGADSMSCRQFMEVLESCSLGLHETLKKHTDPGFDRRISDILPR